ncbi:MAG: DMT family transporter [Candidatus Zixiibacteriota bacterium]|nr:MAG: DMT family transporter [candidate division Zixibacteria bacterium]
MPEFDVPFSNFGETLALVTAVTWAFAVILFKKSGESVHPLTLNLFKNLLAFILFIPTVYIFGNELFRPVPSNEYWLLIISGIIGIGIGDTLFLKSLNLLGAGLQSIVSCMYSPSIITLSFVWLGESMSALQIIGAVMIISAVLTAVSRKGKGNISRKNLIWGISLGIISHAASAVGIVMIKTLLERSPLLWVTEIRLFGGIVALLIVFFLHPDRRNILKSIHSRRSWGYTISGSFMGAYLAMVLWLAGMKYTQASIAAALNQTSNVFVFIFAWLLLRETINAQRVIGIILAISGVLLVTFA